MHGFSFEAIRPGIFRRMSIAAFFVLVFLPVIATADPSPLIVRDDFGGNLKTRVETVELLRRNKRPVQIVGGDCLSACTLYLGLKELCIGRDVRFGFHGPASNLPGIALPRQSFDHWSALMARHYPRTLRDWFMSTARYRIVGFHFLSGVELLNIGYKECPKQAR